MSHIVEVNEEGALYLPSELLAQLMGVAKPHTRYVLEARDGGLLLSVMSSPQPFWTTATPEERARAFHEWARTHESGPGLADEWVNRDRIYD